MVNYRVECVQEKDPGDIVEPGAADSPESLERLLVVEQYQPIPYTDLHVHAIRLDVHGVLSRTQGWRIVSHTFTVQDNGVALASYLLKKKETGEASG